MQDIINFVKEQSFMVKIIIFLGLFVLYSFFAVLLNKYNNVKHGKVRGLAWVPILNIYLLGELAIHWFVGILLLIMLFFGVCITFDIPGLESIHNLIPSDYVVPYQIFYGVLLLILCVVVRVKYRKILSNGTSKDTMNEFINRDFDKKKTEVVANTKPVEEVKEMIKDDFQYTHSTLTDLSNKNDDNKENPQ